MKIFNKSEEWNTKVNFVDESNVLLGYDTDQSCCESAGWFISNSALPTAKEIGDEPQELKSPEDWRFDVRFFMETTDVILDKENSYNPLDEGSVAVFRLVNIKTKEVKFLHLFNCHNGYYGHGFEFKWEGKMIQEGCL